MKKFILASLFAATTALAGPYDPAPTPALAPDEAVKHFRVPEGFEVRLFAVEPEVVNPVAMTWDDRGRLWVVELLDYPYTTKEGAKNRDRVKVLEDTDGDGRADKVTVFADGLNLATAIAIGNGGVYIGAAPNLWFMQDTNGDDKADVKKVLLTGFGTDDRHELLNCFNWGPDGQLYFTQGVFTQSNVTDPEHPERPPVKFNAGVMRFNPADKHIELWADGISNQWGTDWDAKGNVFVSACVVEHLWHVVPGGIYIRQGGIPGWPYAYDLLKHINDHKHYRAAYAGIDIYQGGQYPDQYNGTAFMGNIHGNCINHDKLVPNGSSFIGRDLHKGKDHVDDAFLNSTDGWFRPVSTQTGPDGNLWIADWYDKYPCYQNSRAPDLDRDKGRIWRVVYTGKDKGKAVPTHPDNLDLAKQDNNWLIAYLVHPNVWFRRHAQRLLTERLQTGTIADRAFVKARIVEQLHKDLPLEGPRLALLWTMDSAGLLDAATLDWCAASKEETVRSWAARLTSSQRNLDDQALTRLAKLAGDKSNVVRAGVAEAAKRLVDAGHDITPIVAILLQQGGTATDPMLSQLIWYATETIATKNPIALFEAMASNSQIIETAGPLVPRSIARRLYSSNDPKLVTPLLDFLKSNKDKPITAVMLDGMIAGHKKFMPPPANSEEILAALQSSTDKSVVAKAKHLAGLWGAKAAVDLAIKTVTDPKASNSDRLSALAVVRNQKTPAARAALLSLITDKKKQNLKTEAIRALGEIGDDTTGQEIVKAWPNIPQDTRRSAVDVLVSKPAWAKAMLEGIQKKTISPNDVPLQARRSLADQKALAPLIAATLGTYRPTPGDKEKIIETKKAIVRAGPYDKQKGHDLFMKNCAVCHQLNGEGAQLLVGPDLTGVGRGTLDLLLNNVIDPDQIIGAGYENTIIDTNDGETHSGRVVEDTPDYVKLLSAGPKEDIIQKKNIKERRTSQKSVMPEGFDQILKDDEFRDLIRYVLEAPVGKQ
jgi:putative membrane-bound dehydrogenase-like protein